MSSENDAEPVIRTEALRTHFGSNQGLLSALAGRTAPAVRALDGIDISIGRRRIFGLVGESGSGKSTLGMTLVRMHEPTSGEIYFNGRAITHVKGRDLKAYRARSQILFQDPFSSINPRLTVGQAVEEPLQIHGIGNAETRREKVERVLEHVHLTPADYLHRYPGDMSGGQRQRIAIARALVMEPDFIIADEPVSMLDVSIQASVLELLSDLARKLGLSILYISHDISTVGYICDDVGVMYLGQIVEQAPAAELLRRPLHPYAQQLVAAVPRIDFGSKRQRVELKGEVPSPLNIPKGCRFSPRCMYATEVCTRVAPPLHQVGTGQAVRCHIHAPAAEKSAGNYPSFDRRTQEDEHVPAG